MTDLNQKLISKQANLMSFEQLSSQVQSQLNGVVQKNQQLMKKADSEPDPVFLKNFQNYKKQIFDDICQTQETIKFLMNKAKTVTQKGIGKKYNDQIQQQVDRYKTSVKKIMNTSFAQKHETLRRQSFANNSRSVDSDGMEESGRNDHSQGQFYNQQQQHEDQQQQEWVKNEQQLLEEQQEDLNKFEKEIILINQNFNRIGEMIVEQGHHIDIIEDQHFETKQQVEASKKEITQANEYQKSAKRKYIIFALIILIALGVTLAIVLTQM